MRVSLNWIKQFTEVDMTVDKLVEKIGAQLGAVEHIESLGERYQGIIVAKVVSCVKHPNADKLSVCLINDGGAAKKVKRDLAGLVQVVCGAKNVAAGQLVAWIQPGATVPSTFGKDPFVLEAKELRGFISNGMIASAEELAIGDSHEGILVLDNKARVGTSLAKHLELDDFIIDIENKMFTHRPDCFGILGVAREIAGISGKAFKSPAWYREEPRFAGRQGLPLKIKNELPKLVPRFCAVTISGVRLKESPAWLQSYLARVGVRPINSVVDLTNYYMLETGQPLHAYDYDKLKTATLGVRLSKAGETVKLIGDKDIKLKVGAVVITDGVRPIGLGGVMGGADTEVDENTKNIVLECATFDMNQTRKTAMIYGLFTDAATRFTKNQSPRQNLAVIAKAATEIVRTSSGRSAKIIDEKHFTQKTPVIDVPAKFINERLGLSLGPIEMKRLLDNVEFKVRRDAGKLAITPPFWRTDIEMPEDIVEEIGRLYGYEHLPLSLPARSIEPTAIDPLLALKSRLRQILTRAGANEVLTYSFVHASLMGKTGQDPKKAYHIKNAISPDLQYYRLSLMPSLLEKVHPNLKAGFYKFALFEIGKTHFVGEMDASDSKVPNEDNHVALVVAHGDKRSPSGAPYYQARRYLERLLGSQITKLSPLASFDLTKDEWGKQLTAPYEPSRSAVILKDDQIWGVIGEFKSSVRQALKLPAFAAGFEVHLEVVTSLAPSYQPLNKYPELEQDICLKHAAKQTYAELEQFINQFLDKTQKSQGYNYDLEPLDIFQKPADKTHKQTTWRLSLSHPERTLTTPEANKLLDELATEAHAKLGAQRI